jgi:hypothetical protein
MEPTNPRSGKMDDFSRAHPTHTSPSNSAVYRVFHLPELLESILIQLSVKDILLSQRTAQCFRQTIHGSVRLKRELFLEPDWNLEGQLAHAPSNRPARKPDNNRLLLRGFPGCYPTITLVIMRDGIGGAPAPSDNTAVGSGKQSGEQWSWVSPRPKSYPPSPGRIFH